MGRQSTMPSGAIKAFEPPTADIGASTSFFAQTLETYLGGATVSDATSRFGRAGYVVVPDIVAAIACRTAAGWQTLTDIIDLPAGIGRIAYMFDAAGDRVGLHQP